MEKVYLEIPRQAACRGVCCVGVGVVSSLFAVRAFVQEQCFSSSILLFPTISRLQRGSRC